MIFVSGTIWLHNLRVLPGFADGCWCKLDYSARDAVYSITAECLCPSCSQQPHVTKHARQLSLWAPSMTSSRSLCRGDGLFFSPWFAYTSDLTFIFNIFTNQAAIRFLQNTREKQKVDQSVWLISQCWLDILHTYQYWTDLTMMWVCWCKASP